MHELVAWAICDTDGGRHEPRPLVRYIYGSEASAVDIRNRKFDEVKEYYPIRKIRIAEAIEDES